MTSINAQLDQVEIIKELKDLDGKILSKFGEIEKTYERANGEIKTMGEVQAETKGKMEAFAKQYDELYDRLQVVEQKGAVSSQSTKPESLGEQFAKSDSFLAMKEGKQGRARMELKTAIINATGASQPLVQADRLSGIATTPNRMLSIRDVLPTSTTDSNLVEFTRENAFTNNAGPTVSGSPQAFENVTKPESGITFTLVSAAVVTLAHFIPASVQVLDDSASLASHINGRLMYGLKLKEETQLLSGTGANHQLHGLVTQATSYTPKSPQYTNEIDIIRHAIRQAHIAEYQPDFLVLNPSDWFDIEIRHVGTGDARYVIGDPRSMLDRVLWGLRVVVTNSITAGTFLLGSSMGAEIKDRQMAAVEASREDSTNFQKNMVTIRAEERLTLCVYRTEAFITGSL
jgi:HK97 family phage major capsid protein